MNRRLWPAAMVLALALGCSREEQGPLPAALDVASLIPAVTSMPEWSLAEQLIQYAPDTLFQYVDGAAPRYLSYGFKELAHIRYAYRGDDLSSITLDVYDMGSPLGAYGIYSSGRSRDISPRAWGAEGYLSGTIAVAWKQQVYVYCSADNETPALGKMLEQLMDRVTSAIPGDNRKPDILSALPPEGLVPYSDRYIGKDLLGHSFLPGGLLANYQIEGQESMVFFSDLGSAEAAEGAVQRWRGYEGERGKVSGNEDQVGESGFWAEDPGLGSGVVVRTGRYVAGIWGVPSEDAAARRILGQLVTNLKLRSLRRSETH